MADAVVKDWTTEAGLRAVIRLINDNHHCGYVLVPKDHAFWGVCTYDGDYIGDAMSGLKVHGGITYSEDYLYGITSPEQAVSREEWWLGFDCNHCWDLGLKNGDSIFRSPGATFKDLAYVERECERLAKQIAEWKAQI